MSKRKAADPVSSDSMVPIKRRVIPTKSKVENFISLIGPTVRNEAFRGTIRKYSLDKSCVLHQEYTDIDVHLYARYMRECMRYPYKTFFLASDAQKTEIIGDFLEDYANVDLVKDPALLDIRVFNRNKHKLLELFLHFLIFNKPEVYDAGGVKTDEGVYPFTDSVNNAIHGCVLRYRFHLYQTKKEGTTADVIGSIDSEQYKTIEKQYKQALWESLPLYLDFVPISTRSAEQTTGEERLKFSEPADEYNSSEDEYDTDKPELEAASAKLLYYIHQILEFIVDPSDIIDIHDIENISTIHMQDKPKADATQKQLQKYGRYEKLMTARTHKQTKELGRYAHSLEDDSSDDVSFIKTDTQQFIRSYQTLCNGLLKDEEAANFEQKYGAYLELDDNTHNDAQLKQTTGIIDNLCRVQAELNRLHFHYGDIGVNQEGSKSKRKELVGVLDGLTTDFKVAYARKVPEMLGVSAKTVTLSKEEVDFLIKRPMREFTLDFYQSYTQNIGANFDLTLQFPKGKMEGNKEKIVANIKKHLYTSQDYFHTLCLNLADDRYLPSTNDALLQKIQLETGLSMQKRLAERCFVFFELCMYRITPKLIKAVMFSNEADLKTESDERYSDIYEKRQKRWYGRLKHMGDDLKEVCKGLLADSEHKNRDFNISNVLDETILVFFTKKQLIQIAAVAVWMWHPENPNTPMQLKDAYDTLVQKNRKRVRHESVDADELDGILNDFLDIQCDPPPKRDEINAIKFHINRIKPTWILYDDRHVDEEEVQFYLYLVLKTLECWVIRWVDIAYEDKSNDADIIKWLQEKEEKKKAKAAKRVKKSKKGAPKSKYEEMFLSDPDADDDPKPQDDDLKQLIVSKTDITQYWLGPPCEDLAGHILKVCEKYRASEELESVVDLDYPLIQGMVKQVLKYIKPIDIAYTINKTKYISAFEPDAEQTISKKLYIYHISLSINAKKISLKTKKNAVLLQKYADNITKSGEEEYNLDLQPKADNTKKKQVQLISWVVNTATECQLLFQVILDQHFDHDSIFYRSLLLLNSIPDDQPIPQNSNDDDYMSVTLLNLVYHAVIKFAFREEYTASRAKQLAGQVLVRPKMPEAMPQNPDDEQARSCKQYAADHKEELDAFYEKKQSELGIALYDMISRLQKVHHDACKKLTNIVTRKFFYDLYDADKGRPSTTSTEIEVATPTNDKEVAAQVEAARLTEEKKTHILAAVQYIMENVMQMILDVKSSPKPTVSATTQGSDSDNDT